MNLAAILIVLHQRLCAIENILGHKRFAESPNPAKFSYIHPIFKGSRQVEMFLAEQFTRLRCVARFQELREHFPNPRRGCLVYNQHIMPVDLFCCITQRGAMRGKWEISPIHLRVLRELYALRGLIGFKLRRTHDRINHKFPRWRDGFKIRLFNRNPSDTRLFKPFGNLVILRGVSAEPC